jgi:hypothetical protein
MLPQIEPYLFVGHQAFGSVLWSGSPFGVGSIAREVGKGVYASGASHGGVGRGLVLREPWVWGWPLRWVVPVGECESVLFGIPVDAGVPPAGGLPFWPVDLPTWLGPLWLLRPQPLGQQLVG